MAASYKRSKGSAGPDRIQFQVGLSTVGLLNAMRKFKGWRISTENEDADKLDDVVIEFSDGTAVLLQAKLRGNKKINKDQLLSSNSKNADFSLPKYFLSYQEIKSRFNVKNIILCTNADLDNMNLKDILELQCASSDSILYYEGETCSYVKIQENILPDLKKRSEMYYDKNLQGKGIDRTIITDDNLKDFLDKLQLFSGYPSKIKLDNVINNLLSNDIDFKLWIGTSSQEINGKVEDWFKDERGEYLDEALANTMFCEIRSNKYRNTLKGYNVSFTCRDISFMEGKQIFHIDAEGGYLLQVLKIHFALQEKHTLYANPDDDVEVHKLVLDAFNLSNYEFLVLVFTKNSNQSSVSEIHLKLKDILDRHIYKKIVIISSKESVQKITQNDIVELDGTVNWKTLTLECRERLLSKKNIIFQGDKVTLKDLLSTSKVEDYDSAANWDVLEKLVKGKMIQVGKRSPDLDENTASYYVNRKFEREIGDHIFGGIKQKQTVTQEDIFNVNEKAILISDRAGTGKTTVLKKLATDLEKKSPLCWIIRIELNEYSRFFSNSLKKKKNCITLRELLNSNDETKLTHELEEYLISMPERVVLMLDGFDEINRHYRKLILNLISKCYNSPSFAKIIVSTRPEVSWELEGILPVTPFGMQPFTKEHQIVFLRSYWEHHLKPNHENKDRCEKYAVALINKMTWINSEKNFVGIPLQIRMLGEIFQENIKWNDTIKWEGCKEFMLGEKEEPILPKRMNLIQLFDMFVDKKFDIFLDKANPTGSAMINSLFISNFKNYLENHQCLALKAILGKEAMQNVNVSQLFSRYQYDKCLETEMLKIGVVQETNKEMEFVHRTFAEYFAAKSIIDISQLTNQFLNQDEYFQYFFIDLILIIDRFAVVRSFIESVLKDMLEYLPASSLEKYQRLPLKPASRIPRSRLLHILAKEGCISIMRLILKCLSHNITKLKVTVDDNNENNNAMNLLQSVIKKDGINIRNEDGNTPLHFASQNGHFDVVRYLVYDSDTSEELVSAVNDMKLLVNYRVDLNVVNKEGYTAFHFAVWEGHLNVVRFLEEQGFDINIRTNEGATALQVAALKGRLEVVKFLIERGVNVDLPDELGITALHLASISGYLDVVKFLVHSGADFKIAEYNDLTNLHYAAISGKLEILKFFKDLGLDFHASDNEGITVLSSAVMRGHLDVVKFLVGCGATVNAIDNTGFSVLHYAALEGHLDVVKFVVKSGALVDAKDDDDDTPLHIAASNGHLGTVKFLVDCGAHVESPDKRVNKNGCTAFHLAVEKGYLNVVRFLEEQGADINVRNNEGDTALHVAALKGHLEVVKFLIERGIDVDLRDNLGITALHIASIRGYLDVVKFLVHSGADINIAESKGFTNMHFAAISGKLEILKFFKDQGLDIDTSDDEGITVLSSAVIRGHLDVVKFLVGCGATVNAIDNVGFSVLHYAALKGHLDVVNFLVEFGALVDAKDDDENTPLHIAAFNGHLGTVKFLVDCGAHVEAPDKRVNKNGCTAFHLAVEMGYLNVVRFLEEQGADINIRTNEGDTALHVAALKGHLEVVKFLIERGVDVDLRNNKGFTALNMASQRGYLDVVKFLVDSGADINIAESNGFTNEHSQTKA